jgi:hypothetical protein
MTFEIAHTHSQHRLSTGVTGGYKTVSKNDGTSTITMEGKYILTLEGLEENGIFKHYHVDNSSSLSTSLIRGIAVYASRELSIQDRCSIVGYTACKMRVDERDEIFRCNYNYSRDGQWYDWCLIEWVDSNNSSQTYPGLILGFIQVNMKNYAVVQSTNDVINMEKLTKEFVCKFSLQPNTPTSVVDIETISNPLLVFKNYGGSMSEYFCILPQRKWGRYFGKRIIVP